MADHDLFVKYNDDTQVFEIKRLEVTFYDRQAKRVKFDDSEQYWREFVGKWWHHTDLSFAPVDPTDEQQIRLDDVNAAAVPAQYLSDVSEYVQYGAINPETSAPYLQDLAGNAEVIEANLERERVRLNQALASHRYQVEVGGTTAPDGTFLLTDRESQGQLNSTYTTLKEGLRPSADWKAPSGWVTVTFDEVSPLARVMATHVQLAFTAERRVSEDIAALTDMTALQEFQVGDAYTTALDELRAAETTPADSTTTA